MIEVEIYYLDYGLRERVVVFILSNTVCQELVCDEQKRGVASKSATDGSVRAFQITGPQLAALWMVLMLHVIAVVVRDFQLPARGELCIDHDTHEARDLARDRPITDKDVNHSNARVHMQPFDLCPPPAPHDAGAQH